MNKKVLFVDDSSTMRRLASMVAKGQGCICSEAESGEQALEVLKSESFDAMIFDINMHGMSGIELLEKVKKDPKHASTPIMMLTTESSSTIKEKAKSLGAKGWITKPFNQEQLKQVLVALLS
jgi:two-component system chemotaxis response regulator CheY